jgi:ABC-type uncharacterized transport system permease subunit
MQQFRGYVSTAALTATSLVGDSPLFLADYGLRIARMAVLLALWRAIFGERAAAGGLTLAAVLTYTLVAEVFAEQLQPRTELSEAFWNGSVALRYLRPLGLFGQFIAEMAGRWLVGFLLCALPVLLLAPLLGVDPRPASPTAGALFLLSLALGITVGLALEFIFGALAVALDQNVYVSELVRAAVGALLSGAIVPLALLPWGLGAAFAWLPFAATAAAPLEIYTGIGPPLPLLARQAVWALLLWPLAHWLWWTNRERITIYGG